MKFSYRAASMAAAVVVGVAGFATPATAKSGGALQTSVIYNSLVAKSGNLPSQGAEAYSFKEFGNEVTFASGTNRQLTNVVLTLSSWGCGTGHWYDDTCSTTPGATFSEPITLNIYGASPDGVNPGSLIATVTQTFAIPYRPSDDDVHCPVSTDPYGTAGRWYDSSLKQCFHGLATNVTFNLASVTVPDTVVYGIAYNTTHEGYTPTGESAACYTSSGGCGYDSLNIALSQDPSNVSVGSDPISNTVWQNATPGEYCDGGAIGANTFRLDSPGNACWGGLIPAVQFKAGGGHS